MKTKFPLALFWPLVMLAACDVGDTPTYPAPAANGFEAASLAASGVGKTVVCHYDRQLDAYYRIEVSSNAVSSHLQHGDRYPASGGLDAACLRATCVDREGAATWSGNGHAYEVFDLGALLTWGEARAEAEALGGHLVTLNSPEENAFVFDLALSGYFGSISPWLGGYQLPGSAEPGGGWAWVTSEPFVFSAWQTGEPNDSGDEYLLVYGEPYTWNDWSEERGDISGYVVEWPIPACGAVAGGGSD